MNDDVIAFMHQQPKKKILCGCVSFFVFWVMPVNRLTKPTYIVLNTKGKHIAVQPAHSPIAVNQPFPYFSTNLEGGDRSIWKAWALG